MGYNMKQHIVIVHHSIQNDRPDVMDVLNQAQLVEEACKRLGYKVSRMEFGENPYDIIRRLQKLKPVVVFNLVEEWFEKGELLHVFPALLKAHHIPYTGVPLEGLFLTTNKLLAKKWMIAHQIPTALFYSPEKAEELDPSRRYILKPIWEEASVGIDAENVFSPSDREKVRRIKQMSSSHYFIEEYIDGREFNISILGGKKGPEIMPMAEIVFSDYFRDKPRIVGYRAKWDEESEEYQGTVRVFPSFKGEEDLPARLKEVCFRCWSAFGLSGYARVDIRVNQNNEIFVLEINGNPCIAPDSGFVAAIREKGYSIEDMVKRIIEDAEK